ncbi:MAG: response regulator [Planctomycetaceae bacterium]|nr:response regulator [Planctomycetaceae bacterium]
MSSTALNTAAPCFPEVVDRLTRNTAPVGYIFFDTDGQGLDCSEGVCQLFGLDSPRDVFDNWEKLSVPVQTNGVPTHDYFHEIIALADISGQLVLHWMHQNTAGDPIPVEVSITRHHFRDQHFLIAALRDLRNVSIKLLESNDIVKSVSDAAPVCIMVWNEQGKVIDCNQNCLEFFGVQKKEDFINRFFEFSPEKQSNGVSSVKAATLYIEQVIKKGRCVFEWMHRHNSGELIPTGVSLVRINHESYSTILAFVQDLRTLKQTELDRDRERRRLTSILNSSPVCFAILSDDGIISYATPFMCNFLGVHAGDTLTPLIPDRKTAEKLMQTSADDIAHWVPVTFKTVFGETKEMLANTFRFTDGDNTETVVWLIDVTQSRRLEQDLKIAKDIAEASTKAKGEFLANMSHEIRTPMNAIIGMTHLVLRTEGLTAQQIEYIETAQQSAHMLLRIINDILDFSKIEAGRMVMEYREFSIETVIADLQSVVAVSLQKKNLELAIDIDPNLPSAVMGDSVRLHQVILNLLSNAVKFTEKGTIRLRAEMVECDPLSAVVRFSVSDSGIGMTPLQIKGLFRPFSQADASTTRQFGGTGLGLAISKRIVELMRGEISCQSEKGHGTTFTFTARFGIPLEGEIVTADDSEEIRTDAMLVGDQYDDLVVVRHYLELLKAKIVGKCATPDEFQKFLDSGKISEADFIVFDLSDLRRDFPPMWAGLQNKKMNPMPELAMVEHPELESVLNELDIQSGVRILQKPVSASEVFNVMAVVLSRKKQAKTETKRRQQQAESKNKSRVAIPDSIRGSKVLLAEDNKINQMVAAELLKIEGFETTVADNGKKAVELLQQQEFDIVLMDIQMPEMDGIEAAKTIRADSRFNNIPILAMTAHAMSGDRELSLQAGMNDHITKPIDPQLLYAALIKWIRK